MAQITQQGAINTTALVVPDLYVQIVPPQNILINGVPSNVVGVVGTASWGPVGVPVLGSNVTDYVTAFGLPQVRKFDMGTHVFTAVQQGANAFNWVRVTDGTDTAAVIGINPSGSLNSLVLYARYTGSVGNNIVATISQGSKNGTWRIVIALPGMQPEVFDNLSGATPSAAWIAIANAINSGNGARGPSQIVFAQPQGGAQANIAPAPVRLAFAGGTDGSANVVAAGLIGSDVLPRQGMYALRGRGCAVALLSDCDDSTQWTTIDAFGLSEGIYMVQTGPISDNIANAVSTKQTAGLDSYASKLMFGDWIWWTDPTTKQVRLVSPQGFVAGRLANLSPERSTLNKPLYSVVGSQKSGLPGSGQALAYSSADLQTLIQAGIDVIANPGAGNLNIWTVRAGHNASSNASAQGDNYTRMTNYIAATLAAGMGQFVGQVINTALFFNIRSTLLSFLQGMLNQGQLGSTDGTPPFSVVCDLSNNPPIRTGLGYVQADVQVRYQAINEKFIVNLEGGQTVTVARQNALTGQVSQ